MTAEVRPGWYVRTHSVPARGGVLYGFTPIALGAVGTETQALFPALSPACVGDVLGNHFASLSLGILICKVTGSSYTCL